MSVTTVLARKWRPKNFSELAGQEHVVRALSNALTQNRLHHAYLFTGTRGVGKTTIARIFAKSLNCVEGITATPCGVCGACTEIDSGRFVDLIELDAASNTQVDNMRELLDGALYVPTSGRFKVYIIDEVHMLSKSAFNAMLKTLEEPPEHVKFILATTDPQKIPVTVLSRCLQFNLKQLPPTLIASHLQYVLTQEEIAFESGAVALIAREAQGSMRDALSLLDQAIAFSAAKVEEAVVRTMLGSIDHGYLLDLLSALQQKNGAELIEIADNMAARSIAFDLALQALATLLHRIALAQTVPEALADDEPERVRLLELAASFSAEEAQLYYQIVIHGRNEINLAPDEYAGFTMTLLRMLAFAPAKSVGEALKVSAPEAKPVEVNLPTQAVRAKTVVVDKLPVVMTDSLDWETLLGQINVGGMAQQLAKHCLLENVSEGRVVLLLSPQHKHLQSNVSVEKLQTALSQYFAKPVQLKIRLGEIAAATPAVVETRTKKLKQDQATNSLAQDTFVQAAINELDAKIVEESIKPLG